MAKEIYRRRFNIDLDGRILKAKEISVQYLDMQLDGSDEDLIDLALEDSIGEITKEDLKHFGLETKFDIYRAIMEFSFKPTLSNEDVEAITKEFNMTIEELSSLSRDAKIQLKNVLSSRIKRNKVAEKKH